jgi:LysR family transcriptional activator of glutamate synthase operon
MELRQLRYLVALAEEGSFTRAAAREHIAQPALSQQIRRLEDEVGLSLAQRTTRSVTITDAGEVLIARARRILSELDAARSWPSSTLLATSCRGCAGFRPGM